MPDISVFRALPYGESRSLANPDVVHVIDSLLAWGGAENRLVEEILHMPNLRHVVVRIFEHDQLDGKLLEAGIPVLSLELAKSREASAIPVAIQRLRRIISELRPSVMHTSLLLSNLIGQVVGALSRPRLPVVSSLTRSGDPEVVRRYFSPAGASWKLNAIDALARSAGRMRHVTYRAVAEHVRASSAKSLGIQEHRITVIPRGLDPSRLPGPDHRQEVRDVLAVRNRPFVVNVGRIARKNGQRHLVHAFQMLREELPEAVLAIVGEGQDAEEDLRRLIAENGLQDSVRLLGFRSDALDLMAGADLVVLSSMTEGLPGVALEAMGVGTPLVAFDTPGTREATEDGSAAVLVPLGDEAGLASAIVGLFRDPARRAELAQYGLDRVRSVYDVSVVASKLEALLRSEGKIDG